MKRISLTRYQSSKFGLEYRQYLERKQSVSRPIPIAGEGSGKSGGLLLRGMRGWSFISTWGYCLV